MTQDDLIELAARIHEARTSEGPEVEAGLARAERLAFRLVAQSGPLPEGADRLLPHDWREMAVETGSADAGAEREARRLAGRMGFKLVKARLAPGAYLDGRYTLLNRQGGFEFEWSDLDSCLSDLRHMRAERLSA